MSNKEDINVICEENRTKVTQKLLVLCLALFACGVVSELPAQVACHGNGRKRCPVVATVTVAFDSTSISVDHATQASAVVKDAAGNPITGQTITWSSLTPDLASVSFSGTVTAIAAGTATIQATASGVAGSASISVTQPIIPAADSLIVLLTSQTVVVGGTVQACAFWAFHDGTVGMRSQDAATCSAIYTAAFTLAQRTIAPYVQQWLDQQ